MRLHLVLGAVAVVVAAGCGQASTDELAAGAQREILPDVAVADGPSRRLAPELPGDDPVFQAAIDAYDGEVIEARVMAVTGFVSHDLGAGYFGQRLFMSLWRPAPADVAMLVCHELVAYANEIDFPATEITVSEKTYADLEWSNDLVAVDDTGACVAART